MVIEIDDKNIEKILSKFSYSDLKNFIKDAIMEKIEDIQDYQKLKETRNDEKIDFEEFLKNENKY